MPPSPHPLISITTIIASAGIFCYNYLSPYSLRKVKVPRFSSFDNNNNNDDPPPSFWVISKQVEFDATTKQASYQRGNIYLVKDCELTGLGGGSGGSIIKDSYSLQRCAATNPNYIETNSENLRKGQVRLDTNEFGWTLFSRYNNKNGNGGENEGSRRISIPTDDDSASFRVDEHRMLMMNEDFYNDCFFARDLGLKRQQKVEYEMLPERTMSLLSSSGMKKRKSENEWCDEAKNTNNNDDETTRYNNDTPTILRNQSSISHGLVWKSQVHEEPEYLLLFSRKNTKSTTSSSSSLTTKFNFFNLFSIVEFPASKEEFEIAFGKDCQFAHSFDATSNKYHIPDDLERRIQNF